MKQLLLATTLCMGLLSGCAATAPVFSGQNDGGVQHPAPPTASYFIANRDLLAAETKWRQNKPAYYSYTLQRSCFCSPEFRQPMAIEVSGSTVTKSTLQADQTPLPLARRTDAISMEGLFDIIHKAVDSKAARIDVKYDEHYGYPLSVSVDQSVQIADEEMYYTASEFKVMTKAKPKAKKTVKKTVKKSNKK
ncbi:DUF6174 domain-containing protein [Thiothrix lacustris]|uniref:DUF6174 domain-containing protein n=1 Tax=Thiothrix lacustris TaxID=525917 RepID=UPI0027E4C016|nr:DUF6174 domain-containing protein [Thiothrix lacustris]WMP19199.1 DUF6174 domain-containing protein [Thiothrix lacustris]